MNGNLSNVRMMAKISLKGKRVLVLGGEENPALPVLKSLGKQNVHLTVASHDPWGPGFFSRYTSARLQSPNPWASESEYVEWVVSTCRIGQYHLIIPLGEKASLWVAKNKRIISDYTAVPFPDFEIYMVCRDKALTMKAAKKIGVPVPKTWYPEEVTIEEICRSVSWPVVVKPRISYGARGIYYPKSPVELKRCYAAAMQECGPCIIQEFIPQDGMQYKVELFIDHDRQVKLIGAYDKPRYYPPEGGSSTLNRTVHNPVICRQAEKIINGIGWYGIADCDFIEDPRDGQYKLMEINPRFTRSIRILVEAGLDFPVALLKSAIGQPVPFSMQYRSGLHMRYLLPDILTFAKSNNRLKMQPSFFKFFGKNLIYEMLSLQDPQPGFYYFLGQLRKLLNRESRQKMIKRQKTSTLRFPNP